MECPVCLEVKRVVHALHITGASAPRHGAVHYVCTTCLNTLIRGVHNTITNVIQCPICREQCSWDAIEEFVTPHMTDGVVGHKTLSKLNGRFVMQHPLYETAVDEQPPPSGRDAVIIREIISFLTAVSNVCETTSGRFRQLLGENSSEDPVTMPQPAPPTDTPLLQHIMMSALRGIEDFSR